MTFIPIGTIDNSGDGVQINGGTGGILITDNSGTGVQIAEVNGNSQLFLASDQAALSTGENTSLTLYPDGHFQFNGLNLFTWNGGGGPNGNVTGLVTGDLCITIEPGLYQWSADATPVWVPVGGFSGTFSGTSGVSLTDDSSGGINIMETGTGAAALGVSGAGVVALYNPTGSFALQADGSYFFQSPGPNVTLFINAANPNGAVTAAEIGDLCVTAEPALYQATAADNASWVPVGANVTSATGVRIIDNSVDGILLSEESAGGATLLLSGGVTMTAPIPVGALVPPVFALSGNSLEFVDAFGGGYFTFFYATNPNGHVTSLSGNDLCITAEPGLYQSTANDDSHWVQVGASTSPVPSDLAFVGYAGSSPRSNLVFVTSAFRAVQGPALGLVDTNGSLAQATSGPYAGRVVLDLNAFTDDLQIIQLIAANPNQIAFEGTGGPVLWDATGVQFVRGCAGGSVTDKIETSPDGDTWTGRAVPLTAQVQGLVEVGSGRLVAVGYDSASTISVATSDDHGVTWATPASPFDGGIPSGAAFDGTQILACGLNVGGTNTLIRSLDDGDTWTTVTSPFDTFSPSGICWSSALGWVMTGTATGAGCLYTSPDGDTWTVRATIMDGDGGGAGGCCAGPSGLIAWGSSEDQLACYSVDGVTWLQLSMLFGVSAFAPVVKPG